MELGRPKPAVRVNCASQYFCFGGKYFLRTLFPNLHKKNKINDFLTGFLGNSNRDGVQLYKIIVWPYEGLNK